MREKVEVLERDGWYTLEYLPDYGAFRLSHQTTADGGWHRLGFGKDGEAARAAWAAMMAKPRCRECGDPPFGTYMDSSQRQMDERQLCFSCNHWTNKIAELTKDHAIIDGQIYRIEPDKPKGYQGFVGHAGAEFSIRFNDGREVVTHNLWAGGPIPEHFQGRLPDNAEWVRRAEYSGYVGSGSASCTTHQHAKAESR